MCGMNFTASDVIMYGFNQLNHSLAQEWHVFRQTIYYIDARPLNYGKTEGRPKA